MSYFDTLFAKALAGESGGGELKTFSVAISNTSPTASQTWLDYDYLTIDKYPYYEEVPQGATQYDYPSIDRGYVYNKSDDPNDPVSPVTLEVVAYGGVAFVSFPYLSMETHNAVVTGDIDFVYNDENLNYCYAVIRGDGTIGVNGYTD